jgi:hypothetical protein
MFDVRFRKALEANACERGGSAGVIYVVCIFVCVFVRFPLETGVKGKVLVRAVRLLPSSASVSFPHLSKAK